MAWCLLTLVLTVTKGQLTCAWCSEVREGAESPKTGAPDICELRMGGGN